MPNKLDLTLLDRPSLATSRRNFIAGASVLAGALVATAVSAKRAMAKDEPPGCDNEQPDISNPNCNPHCFLFGTHIATPNGEREIERLRIGDLVISGSGERRPIKWIGRRHLTRHSSQGWNQSVLPIKIARSALDGVNPHRDLYLSEEHAIYLGGLLIPAKNLINGSNITRTNPADALTLDYYHLELEEHDVVFAEGAYTETFSGDSRSGFDNAEEYYALYGAPTAIARSFAPIAPGNVRQDLMSRLRSVVSPIHDGRKPFDVIRDQIAARGELGLAA